VVQATAATAVVQRRCKRAPRTGIETRRGGLSDFAHRRRIAADTELNRRFEKLGGTIVDQVLIRPRALVYAVGIAIVCTGMFLASIW
jgi:hypothetical protein